MDDWLQLRPLIVFLVAGPVLVIVVLLALRVRRRRGAKRRIDASLYKIQSTTLPEQRVQYPHRDRGTESRASEK